MDNLNAVPAHRIRKLPQLLRRLEMPARSNGLADKARLGEALRVQSLLDFQGCEIVAVGWEAAVRIRCCQPGSTEGSRFDFGNLCV